MKHKTKQYKVLIKKQAHLFMNWEKLRRSARESNIWKNQNLFVKWKQLESKASDQHSKNPVYESLDELRKITS